MATPLAHGIVGLAAGQFHGPVGWGRSWRWYAFAIIAANAADLDFVPGLLVGDINRYHQLMSHSLIAAVVFGVLVWLFMRRRTEAPVRLGLLSGIIYASHLLLDGFTYDGSSPVGVPLLWPFSQAYFHAPWTLFEGVGHGVPGESFTVVMAYIFSWKNLGILAFDTAVLLPILGAAWYFGQGRSRGWRRVRAVEGSTRAGNR